MFSRIKKCLLIGLIFSLSACSLWQGEKKVINLSKEQLDQKSYAVAYEATIHSKKAIVNKDYDVNSFSVGVKDWFERRVSMSVHDIEMKLALGLESKIHAYYSGAVFAANLQKNFSRLSKTCWQKIDPPSLSQGVYEAMLDLKKGMDRSETDGYISQGSEILLKVCR